MKNGKNNIPDRIREYLLTQQKAGKLNAGDKLPSYSQLCKRFKVSYASIQYAFKEFEKDGLVERVQGVGTFLKGSDPLEIEIFLDTNAFPSEKLEPLLAKAIADQGLHLTVKIRKLHEIFKINTLTNRRRVIIAQATVEPHVNPGSLLDLSSFSDYRFSVGQLKTFNDGGNCNIAMPFHSFTYQIAYNPELLNRLGFSGNIRGDDLGWWHDYVRLCRQKNIIPAAKGWQQNSLVSFASINQIIFPLIVRERKNSHKLVSLPIFDTDSGRQMLKIMKDHTTFPNTKNDIPHFCNGKIGVTLGIGSWLAVHYREKFNLAEDAFKIIPHRFGDRKICQTTLQYLKPFVCADIKPDEKERVWKFLKIFISRNFQIKLCEMNGMVSVRKDVTPEDHPWNTREDFSAFFSDDNDIIIYNDIFNERVNTALSTLYEQYEFFGADQNQILSSMDKKVESMLRPM